MVVFIMRCRHGSTLSNASFSIQHSSPPPPLPCKVYRNCPVKYAPLDLKVCHRGNSTLSLSSQISYCSFIASVFNYIIHTTASRYVFLFFFLHLKGYFFSKTIQSYIDSYYRALSFHWQTTNHFSLYSFMILDTFFV